MGSIRGAKALGDLMDEMARPGSGWAEVRPPVEGDGTIFSSLYREIIIGEPPPLPPPQPARPDLRKLICQICGAPASPHRAAHAVIVVIPAREAKLP